MSEVQSVKLSRSSCMMRVLSLYDSSPSVSSSAIASSNACTWLDTRLNTAADEVVPSSGLIQF